MSIHFIQRQVNKTKSLPEQGQLNYSLVASNKKTVVKTMQCVRKYYCDMLLWKGVIILTYILVFSCMRIITANDED